MTEATGVNAAKGESASEHPAKNKPLPRHMEILDDLENRAREWARGEAERRRDRRSSTTGRDWTLAQDSRLATFAHEFTLHVHRRATDVARSVERLDAGVRRTSVDVQSARLGFSRLADATLIEQVVEETVADVVITSELAGADGTFGAQGGDDVGGGGDAEREEDAALEDGMAALSLYYDPGVAGDMVPDHYFGLDGVEDPCHYYDSVPGDEFNQRKLPYLIGSREFMESTDAGLGEEDEIQEVSSEGSEVLDGLVAQGY